MINVCILTVHKSNQPASIIEINIVYDFFCWEQKNFNFKHEHSKLFANTHRSNGRD